MVPSDFRKMNCKHSLYFKRGGLSVPYCAAGNVLNNSDETLYMNA